VVDAERGVWRGLLDDVTLVYAYATAIFAVLAVSTELLASLFSIEGPSTARLVGAVLIAGLLATTLSNFVGYFGALGTFRYGLDPDNFGIPLVSAASDLLGAASFMLSLVVFGLT